MAGRPSKINYDIKELIEDLKSPVISEFMGAEKGFQQYLIENLVEIMSFTGKTIINVEEQKVLLFKDFKVILDIVIYWDDGSCSILEVKKYNNKYPSTGANEQCRAIGQVLLYKNVFNAKYGIDPDIYIVDNKIFYRTYVCYKSFNLPVRFIEVQNDRVMVIY